MFRFIVKFLGIFLFIAALFLVSTKLFFEDDFNKYYNKGIHIIFPNIASSERLRVAISSDIITYSPTSYETVSRGVLMNVYDSLIRPNKFLQLKPQLALSWGVLDDKLTWEFKLRKEVFFHDGTTFEADDVIASIKKAKEYPDSQLKNLLANITSYEKTDSHTIRIVTEKPDAVLPRKISALLIFPSEKYDDIDVINPIGTGPYKFATHNKNESIILFENSDYWGRTPKYKDVIISIMQDKFQRLEALNEKKIDILLNVPPTHTEDIKKYEYDLLIRPSLEANFIFFNFNNSVLSKKSVRQAIAHSIDKSSIQNFGSEFVKPIDQFVPAGILGYNPEISAYNFDVDSANKLIKDSYLSGTEILDVVLADRLEILGNYLKKSLSNIGLNVNIKTVPENQLIEEIKKNKADIYFIGWRFDLGDIGDFLGEVIHGTTEDQAWGKLNFTYHENEKMNTLIEQSFSELDPKARAKMLKTIMSIMVEEDIIGIPLFESSSLYAKAPHIKWEPRLDSYFIASEVK